MTKKIACLGPQGTFTEKAARKLFPEAELEFLQDVGEVFEYVDGGEGDGVVAVENSLEGSVGDTLEGLMEYDVKVTGETTLDISLCLMAKEGVKSEDVGFVLSHPHALGQCHRYIKENLPDAVEHATKSTAEAILEVADKVNAAAIGFKNSGLSKGLKVLAQDIQDRVSQTRFIAISKTAKTGPKTSIIFAVKDQPGALYSVLKVFSENNINLTKIESRPSRRKLGEYNFYMDYENRGQNEEEIEKFLEGISAYTTYLKYLGSY